MHPVSTPASRRVWWRLRTCAVGLIALLMACAETQAPADVRLQVTTRDDWGAALANVPVAVDGQVVASSDAAGRAQVGLSARAGRVRVSASCPEGYRSPDPRSLPLKASARQPSLELEFVCRPELRTLLLVVRAPEAAGFVVRADGEPIGTVGRDGTLHALLRRKPEAELRLTLDTSAAPDLVPRNPVREIQVADRDDILVFDQRLAPLAPAPKAPRQGRRAERPPPKHIPFAIGARY